MPMAFRHSLFEMAADVLKRSASTDPNDIVAAIKATNLNTIVGPINFSKGPVPNVAKTPLTGGQWKRAQGGALELVIVDNSQAPVVPVAGKLEPIV